MAMEMVEMSALGEVLVPFKALASCEVLARCEVLTARTVLAEPTRTATTYWRMATATADHGVTASGLTAAYAVSGEG